MGTDEVLPRFEPMSFDTKTTISYFCGLSSVDIQITRVERETMWNLSRRLFWGSLRRWSKTTVSCRFRSRWNHSKSHQFKIQTDLSFRRNQNSILFSAADSCLFIAYFSMARSQWRNWSFIPVEKLFSHQRGTGNEFNCWKTEQKHCRDCNLRQV